MDPFYIACTTCKSRLKVRSASAIGQILSCPKCGSMVMVDPPPTAQPPAADESAQRRLAAAAAAGAPLLDSALADSALVDGALADEAPAAEPAQPTSTSSAPTETDPSSLESPPAGESLSTSNGSDAPPNSVEPQAPEPAATASSAPVLPNAEWTSPATRQLQQWLLYSGAAIVGIVLAFAVVGFAVYQFSGNNTAAADNPPETIAQADDPDTDSDDDSASGKDSQAAAESAPTDSETPGIDESIQPPVEVPPVDDSAANDKAAHHPPPKLPPQDFNDNSSTDNTSTLPPLPDAIQPPNDDDAPKTPAPPNAAESQQEVAANGAGEADRELAAISRSFPDFPRLLDDQPDLLTPLDDEAATGAGGPALESRSSATTSDDAPPALDVSARLSETILGVEFPQMPLADFLRLATDLSTVPIGLDLDALAALGLTPETPVAIRQTQTTVGGMLTAGLKPLDLEFVEEDGYATVTVARGVDAAAKPAIFDVSDLTGGDSEHTQQLADHIQRVIAPGAWTPAGKPPRLHIEEASRLAVNHSVKVKHMVGVLLDKLRVARGLKPQGSAVVLTPRSDRAADMLARPVTKNFSTPAPVARILGDLRESTGARILIDWSSVSPAGVSTSTTGTLSTIDAPLEQALQELLEPLGLTYRVVDQRTLQATSAAELATRLELEVYPVGDLLSEQLSGARLVKRIDAHLNGALIQKSSPRAAVIYNESTNCLLAYLPQLQQVKLSKLIEYWRASP